MAEPRGPQSNGQRPAGVPAGPRAASLLRRGRALCSPAFSGSPVPADAHSILRRGLGPHVWLLLHVLPDPLVFPLATVPIGEYTRRTPLHNGHTRVASLLPPASSLASSLFNLASLLILSSIIRVLFLSLSLAPSRLWLYPAISRQWMHEYEGGVVGIARVFSFRLLYLVFLFFSFLFFYFPFSFLSFSFLFYTFLFLFHDPLFFHFSYSTIWPVVVSISREH